MPESTPWPVHTCSQLPKPCNTHTGGYLQADSEDVELPINVAAEKASIPVRTSGAAGQRQTSRAGDMQAAAGAHLHEEPATHAKAEGALFPGSTMRVEVPSAPQIPGSPLRISWQEADTAAQQLQQNLPYGIRRSTLCKVICVAQSGWCSVLCGCYCNNICPPCLTVLMPLSMLSNLHDGHVCCVQAGMRAVA